MVCVCIIVSIYIDTGIVNKKIGTTAFLVLNHTRIEAIGL